MVLAMFHRRDLKEALNRVFADYEYKQVYRKNDSYIWQCENEIKNILDILLKIPQDKLIPPTNPIVIEFNKWQEENRRKIIGQLAELIQAPMQHRAPADIRLDGTVRRIRSVSRSADDQRNSLSVKKTR